MSAHGMQTVPMVADRDACYRALRTRDARFDGRFFICVRSTGVYCRPVERTQMKKRPSKRASRVRSAR